MGFSRLPHLVRFMLAHAALGFGLSTLFVLALMMSDFGGLASLMIRSDIWPLPILLLWFFTGLTFGSVQMGAAIILLGNEPEGGGGGGGRRMKLIPAVLTVPVRTRRPRP